MRKMFIVFLGLSALLWASPSDNNTVTIQPQKSSESSAVYPLLVTALPFSITIPKILSYQGKLTDASGNPVPDTTHQITFRLYTQETGGTPFWSETQVVTPKNGLFSVLLGSITPIPSVPDNGQLYLAMAIEGTELSPRLRIGAAAYAFLTERAANADSAQVANNAHRLENNALTDLDNRYVNTNEANSVTSAMIIDGTVVRADVVGNFKAPYADTADYAKVAPAVDSANVSANSHQLQGKDTLGLSTKFVDEGQPNSITSTMIVNGTIVRTDVASNFKAPYADTADYAHTAPAVDSANVAGNSHKLQGKDTLGLSAKFVDEGQPNSITSTMITNGTILGADINQMDAAPGQVLKWTVNGWMPKDDSVGGDRAWMRSTPPDSVIYTFNQLGIARGKSGNMLYGFYKYTHTNFGVACTTGAEGFNRYYCTVGGGLHNIASGEAAVISGGSYNTASDWYSAVSGGTGNAASGRYSYIGGGYADTAAGYAATIGGGYANTAKDSAATVAGGRFNLSSAPYACVGGGYADSASGYAAIVPGGWQNSARGAFSFAAGRYARANHNGSFVWSDSAPSADDSVYTEGANQWRVRARGGAWFFSNLAMDAGVVLEPGSNSWSSVCDSLNKEDFREVDKRLLLEKIASLRIRNYKLRSQNNGTRHIGPVAQDFYNAFGYGETNTAINMADADGVLFAAIQALYEENQELRKELAALKVKIEQMK
ncbi:MAG: tail fiber domain-containing protein [candidate division WOR-3 bacterium]